MKPRRTFAIALTLVLGVGAVAVVLLLDGVGRWLVVVDPLEPADAIFVLGGATPARELEAAALYHRGLAPRVVLSLVGDSPGERYRRSAGLPPYQERRAQVLEHARVPAASVIRLAPVVDSTREEIKEDLAYARVHGFKRVIFVTSAYHTRRVRIIAQAESGGHAPAPLVYPTPYGSFDQNRWWRSREDVEATAHEIAGIVYFLLGSPFSSRGESSTDRGRPAGASKLSGR
jgi:uncharacterized SAM-binding protein YcdF (DUF218 family)